METTTIPSWMDQIQADITEMESDWRQLDEQEWRAQDRGSLAQLARGKQVKEAEAGRLRAELAVASFVERFYARGETEIAGNLLARAEEKRAIYPIPMKEFARFVRAEAEQSTLPGLEMRWGPPASTADRTTGGWWIDLEGVPFLGEQEQSARRFRFHAVGDSVDAWLPLPKESLAAR
jgi:hypothetical protein